MTFILLNQILHARVELRCKLTGQMSPDSVYSVALEKRKKFTFFQICYSAVAPPSVVEKKLNAGAQLQTFPFQMMSISFPNSNALIVQLRSQTLSFKSATSIGANKKQTTKPKQRS